MPVSGSISDFIPHGYQRSADRDRLFLTEYWENYYDLTGTVIDFLCTQRYRNRPDIGYIPVRDQLRFQLLPFLVLMETKY